MCPTVWNQNKIFSYFKFFDPFFGQFTVFTKNTTQYSSTDFYVSCTHCCCKDNRHVLSISISSIKLSKGMVGALEIMKIEIIIWYPSEVPASYGLRPVWVYNCTPTLVDRCHLTYSLHFWWSSQNWSFFSQKTPNCSKNAKQKFGKKRVNFGRIIKNARDMIDAIIM